MPIPERDTSNKLAYASFLVGVLGIIMAIYFYEGSIREREPCFVTDPVRTEILKSKQVSGVPIKVTRTDGTEIKSDLSSIRFYLWNNGKASIRSGDVLKQISIRLDDQNARIIYPTILKISREVTGIKVTPDPHDPERVLLVDFTILEKNDGLTGQVIYEGKPDAQLVISGIIEGTESFRSEAFFQKKTRRAGYIVFVSILVLLSALLLGTLRESFKWLNTTPVPFKKNRVRVLVIIVHLAIFAGITYAFYFRTLQSIQRIDEKIVANDIPQNILPQ